MTIDTTTAAQGVAAAKSLTSAAANTGKTGTDFNMFLKLLTTQMQNQDPLDPMKTSEYTSQLAQYSQIEQSVQQSGTLKDILAHLTTQDLSQASGYIGREAVFNSPVAGLSADPATWAYSAARAPAGLTATVTDASGAVVDTRTIDPSSAAGRFSWDGATATGAHAAHGAYTLSIAAVDAAGATIPVTISSVGTVSGVTSSAGVVSVGVRGVSLPASTLISVAAL